MKTRTCNKCGEEKPATLEFFHKQRTRADGSIALKPKCKTCQSKYHSGWRDQNPDYVSPCIAENPNYKSEYCKDWRVDNPEYGKKWREDNADDIRQYNKKRHRAKRIAEGKPLDALAPKRFFYIGYLYETHGTYFKVGITSHSNMRDRYIKVPVDKPSFIDCQNLRWVELDTEDEARAMEKDYIARCTKILGEPVLRKERFALPKPIQLFNILEGVTNGKSNANTATKEKGCKKENCQEG